MTVGHLRDAALRVEDIINRAVLKRWVAVTEQLASNGLAVALKLSDIAQAVGELATIVNAHQLALERMQAVQRALANSIQQGGVDTRLPAPKAPDTDGKPN